MIRTYVLLYLLLFSVAVAVSTSKNVQNVQTPLLPVIDQPIIIEENVEFEGFTQQTQINEFIHKTIYVKEGL
jgi:hypothetical protein